MIENLPTRLLGTDEIDDSTLRDALDAFIQQGLRSVAANERRSTDGVEYVRWIERDERHARLCGKIWELASVMKTPSARSGSTCPERVRTGKSIGRCITASIRR